MPPSFRAVGSSGFEDTKVYFPVASESDEERFRDLMWTGGLQGEDTYRGLTAAANNEVFGVSPINENDTSFNFGELNLNAKQQSLDSLNPKFGSQQQQQQASYKPRVEPPFAPANYVETSSVTAEAEPSYLVTVLLTVLRRMGVDCVVKHEEFRLACCALKGCSRLTFSARVWRLEQLQDKGSSGQYSVELQRRAGCALHFAEVFRQAKAALAQENVLVASVGASDALDAAAPPPLEASVTAEQVKQTVAALSKMAGSKCVELKVQGLAALADLTADSSRQSQLVELKVLDMLLTELCLASAANASTNASTASEDADIARCAVTGIANLCRDRADKLCPKLQQCGAVKTLLALAKHKSTQLVRETARLLSIVATALGTKVLDNEFKATLKLLMGSSDPKAREYVSQVLEQL